MKISSVDLEMRSYLQRIATGPELSKDLSEEEAYRAMTHILAGSADEVQSAIFLIALRMKRETDAENCGALRALLDSTVQVRSGVADILHIADPFDGFVRGLPAAPFLPAVLAAVGSPQSVRALSRSGRSTVLLTARSLQPRVRQWNWSRLRQQCNLKIRPVAGHMLTRDTPVLVCTSWLIFGHEL